MVPFSYQFQVNIVTPAQPRTGALRVNTRSRPLNVQSKRSRGSTVSMGTQGGKWAANAGSPPSASVRMFSRVMVGRRFDLSGDSVTPNVPTLFSGESIFIRAPSVSGRLRQDSCRSR
ncbi:hypothetical protein OBBRIDRAFT_338634 [Obba rivulosa]|uniref:Uncharacterized protein n=1 Tax=Obba rivulosa TaxID=1052685 RepID=A0A8E2DPA8_9APHY|nr:hypothetical protein OBBRIDRAFT_338634 [Obba rivulosa]